MAKSIYDDEYRSLIKRLRDHRVLVGMTQQALADALGKPQSFVAKVEGCERRLDVIEFKHWCEVLDVESAKFL
ncbi:helix-turn-helix domain-containing protein [Ruegeria denitrificans]|uniref:helix-turn-helix domain-containing protein n=1 Tax=Ruegeria denitrificans TaxID=1715692 RepID=UPI003C7D77D0